MKSVSISQIGNEIRQAAQERINCGDPQTVSHMEPGMAYRQGDIGVVMLKALPDGAKKIENPANRQVAPGTNRGSRHCVDPADVVSFYTIDDGDVLSDLCVTARKAGFTLRHPEHADVTFPRGTYRFIHQQNERRERVLD